MVTLGQISEKATRTTGACLACRSNCLFLRIMERCVSGKRMYPSQEIAEDVLIESWIRFEYAEGSGPVAVYQCDDCGRFHLTSQGPMNEKLAEALSKGIIRRQREARNWADKFKRR
jgi:hypothetical protein